MALKPFAIREAHFARRWLTRGCYRRLRRDAKRAATRVRRRFGGTRTTKGWL